MINLGEVSGDQPNRQGGDILLKIQPPLGARNGNGVISVGQHPGERKLRCRTTLPLHVSFEGPAPRLIRLKRLLALMGHRLRWSLGGLDNVSA